MIEDNPAILRHFTSCGGIADFTELDDAVKLFWQLPARYLSDALNPARMSRERSDEEFPSFTAFIQNGSFNAAIRHEENAVAAGIFCGVPMVAFRACRLFALRMDLASGLPVRDEHDHLIIFGDRIILPSEWLSVTDPSREALEEIIRFEETTDQTNNELALFMFDIAMRYVAMHECMHFVLGHARFCQLNLGLDIFEDASERRAELDPITSQTLEFIADRHTISGLAKDLDHGRIFHEWSREAPPGIAVAPPVWRRRILFATLALISRLWAVRGAQTFADFTKPYPHPYERVCWMVSGLSEIEGPAVQQELMLAFALAVGALDRNYETSRQDVPALTRDIEMEAMSGFSSLNYGYSVVRERAIQLQKKLYEEYGPFYPPQPD